MVLLFNYWFRLCMSTRIMQISKGDIHLTQWALFPQQPYCPERLKKALFYHPQPCSEKLESEARQANKATLVSWDKVAAVGQRPITPSKICIILQVIQKPNPITINNLPVY